ncbi:MAG: Na+:solute symporter [Candidatus Dadabacteria bacterium]|nr:Na+:solute symporter [Candidatus Dadabacteria bacterium]MCZ6864802.1 Na+:solute symporter [Candidatus Dadabacteria bacterium]
MPESIETALSALSTLDWVIVAAYLILSLGIGIYFTKRASGSMSSYFVSGRSLPWWILGTSMVATTFAADTPLAVTGWIRTEGIWKNWFWWNYLFSHVFIVLVFARLWRRAEVITDNELIEIRYGGKPAAFLRGFKALYFSTLFNFIVMGWVISAMAKVFKVFFGVDTTIAIVICISIAFFYTMMSGLWGVALTDFLQYFIALFGTIILAWIVIGSPEIGGFSGFIDKLGNIDEKHISFFMTPSGGDPVSAGFWDSSFFAFLVYVSIIWWSSHNADGGGYFIQRINSAKNERHAVLGTAWFAVNHYIIRLWPWILVALATLIIYPRVQDYGGDNEAMYIVVIRDFLGPGLKGLLFVTFLAAFMSTLSTQLNWGASYLMNDIYRRFIKTDASESHYILIARLCTLMLAVLAGYFAFYITNIGKAWIFLWAMSAGVGLVLILRWFWWRINAWSEISALAASLLTILILFIYTKSQGVSLELKHQIIVIPISIITWIVVTFLTKPESNDTLGKFYKRVRPWGWWEPVSKVHPDIVRPQFVPVIYNWLLGVSFIFFGMIGVGKVLLGNYYFGTICLVISIISGVLVYRRMRDELREG